MTDDPRTEGGTEPAGMVGKMTDPYRNSRRPEWSEGGTEREACASVSPSGLACDLVAERHQPDGQDGVRHENDETGIHWSTPPAEPAERHRVWNFDAKADPESLPWCWIAGDHEGYCRPIPPLTGPLPTEAGGVEALAIALDNGPITCTCGRGNDLFCSTCTAAYLIAAGWTPPTCAHDFQTRPTIGPPYESCDGCGAVRELGTGEEG